MLRALLFAVLFSLLTSQCFGLDWANDFNDFFVDPQPIRRGHAGVFISGAQREYSHRIGASGNSEQLGAQRTKISKNLGDATTDTSTDTRSVRQSKLTPMYAYGVTSSWTLALRIGVVSTETDLTDSQTSSKPQVGTAEVLNKQEVLQHQRLAVAVYEDLKFPSAQTTGADYEVNNLPDPRGFGMGVGSAASYQFSPHWQTRMGTLIVYNFEDSVVTQASLQGHGRLQKVQRQPGADFVMSPSLAYKLNAPVQFTFGWLWQSKESDQVKTDQGRLTDQAQSESLAVFGVGYAPSHSGADRGWQFGANLNYYALLGGQNVADANTVGVDLQMFF